MSESISNFTVEGTKFINDTSVGIRRFINSHKPLGGAIYSQKYSDNTYINNCLFSNNNNCSIYYLGSNLIVNNSIFENRLTDISDDTNSLDYSKNIIFSAKDSILENIFWGTNYYSPDEFLEKSIFSINNTYKAPENWFNLELNGPENLDEKGIYNYQLKLISYDGSINGNLPIYNVSLKNNVSYNGLDDSCLIVDGAATLQYEYNKAAMDSICIYNNLGDLIVSKDIFGGVILVSNSSDFTKSIQEAIDNANPDDIIILDSLDFVNVSNVNITKSINIVGKENTAISSDGSGPIFTIVPKSEGGPDNVSISNIIFKLNNKDIVVLSGDLGSGKTKFTEGFLSFWGLQDEISSPTFNIVNEHYTDNTNIYHLDVYRLENKGEFYSIGGTEYFSTGICVIEWGELIEDLLPNNYIKISFSKDQNNDSIRYLNFRAYGERLENVLKELEQ